jgi:hypothetical protein
MSLPSLLLFVGCFGVSASYVERGHMQRELIRAPGNSRFRRRGMKRFLAIYIGTAASFDKSNWNQMDQQQRKEREQAGIKAWGEWMSKNQAAIVAHGGPLGKTKRTSPEGVSDIKNNMTGYVIVQAETHDAAARLFDNHPHFAIFPGESVEIMECLPIPGQ